MPELSGASQHTSEQEEHVSPPDQLASDRALQGNGDPDCDHSQGASFQDNGNQLNASDYQSSSVPEDRLSKHSELDGALSLAVTLNQSQGPVSPLYASSYELASDGALRRIGDSGCDHSQSFMGANSQDHHTQLDTSDYQSSRVCKQCLSRYSELAGALGVTNPDLVCPFCARDFSRKSHRNRHIGIHLPHSILCPDKDCNWTGRRQCDFKEHWTKKHPDAGEVPGEDENKMFNRKGFVNSIIGGTPIVQVARSAHTEAQGLLGRLGKLETNVLGRKKELREWIHTPPS